MNKKPTGGLKFITINRKASFNYFFKDVIEAGIVLKGSEIKSVRSGKINIAESYAVEKNGEIFLVNSHIPIYKQASYSNHNPYSERKLLFNKRGGAGCISVTANVAPKLCSDMQRFSKSNSDNELKEAERIDIMLQPLHKSLFIESNPSPVKYAAKLLGLCDDSVRLPLVKITEQTKFEVKKSLVSAKLLNE